MAGPITMEINMDEAKEFLSKYNDKTKANVNRVVHNSGFEVEAEVKNSIAGRGGEPRSVDTGHFMQTVTTDNSQEFVSRVVSPIDYSIYLEEGTKHIQARHHFGNSFKRKQSSIISNLNDATKV